jgi:hypothetical protein
VPLIGQVAKNSHQADYAMETLDILEASGISSPRLSPFFRCFQVFV